MYLYLSLSHCKIKRYNINISGRYIIYTYYVELEKDKLQNL